MPSHERSPEELRDWGGSGAAWLTGRPDGPPLGPPGRAATFVREALATLGLEIPGLLGERAAYAALGRNAPWSCGGAFRILPTRDGWLGVSLARPSDLELVPALVESRTIAEPWEAVGAWAEVATGAEAAARLRLLGIPGGVVPDVPPSDRSGVKVIATGSRQVTEDPLVVDLTSMWAGPLCAHLLGLGGARIVKVEATARPDGARSGAPAFFELLHRGHAHVDLDFHADIAPLRELIASADLVLEASRPRALRQLGILAEEAVGEGTSWLSITAHGRHSDAVGFGDDVAASAGLVVRPDSGEPIPAGDALADPLTGVAAALAARDALSSEEARLIDVSMLHVVAETLEDADLCAPPAVAVRGADGRWWFDTGDEGVRLMPVEPPAPRGRS